MTWVRRTFEDITHPHFVKQMVWVAAFWVVVVGIILLNIDYLKTHYPNPPRPPDRILDLIPEAEEFIVTGELFSILQVITMSFIMWQWHFRPAPKMLFLLGVMFLLRSFVITLTPLAQIQPPSENYAQTHLIAQTFYHGMYYSGHTASAFIQAFYVKGHRLQPVVFLLVCVQAFALLASHSHYTIDVVGGFFVAYFVTTFDFMQFVPRFLREVRWMPWVDTTTIENQQQDTLITQPTK